jgi:hypothetical protein
MAANMAIPVPTIPPQPPQLSLLNSAVRPDDATDPTIGTDLELVSGDQQALLREQVPDLYAELQRRQGEAWVRGITYAPESHAAAAVRDPCDLTSVDLPALPAPTIEKAVIKAGGALAEEEFEYVVTAINANGETTASAVVAATPAGASKSVTLTVYKIGSAGVKYRFYRCKAGVKKPLRIKTKAVTAVNPYTPAGEGTTFTWTDIGEAEEAGKEAPAENKSAGPGGYTNLGLITAVPYLIRVTDQCSTFAFEARDFKGRALRLLENAQHQAIEKEFWTGAQAIKSTWPNHYLAQETGLTELEAGKKVSPTRGLQLLQDALDTGFGGQGMIHVQKQTATNLTKVRRVGSMMLDMFDNIVVPGAGYPGTGPDKGEGGGGKAPGAGCAYMFASTLVMVRAEKEGTVFPDTFAEAVDWGQGGFPNTIRFYAEKFAVAYLDNSARYCVEVKLEE